MRFKPVIISHHMLMGLKEGQEKMSKSDPLEHARIALTDAPDALADKVRRAKTDSLPGVVYERGARSTTPLGSLSNPPAPSHVAPRGALPG